MDKSPRVSPAGDQLAFLSTRARGSPQLHLISVDGGEASYALLDYDTNVFWQTLCSKGWAVLMLNPVGSSSFGGDFCKRLLGRWGELDLPQHLAAIAQLQDKGSAMAGWA